MPFDGYVEKLARVSSTCLVSVARNRYSVPCERVGQMVSTRLTSPFRTAEKLGIMDIIDLRETHAILCDWVEDAWSLITASGRVPG